MSSWYIYPPRALTKIRPAELNTYDDGKFIAHPKYNGSCGVVYLEDAKTDPQVFNRHNEKMTNVNFDAIDFRSAHRGSGKMILCGEVLNKNQAGENGKPFNHKFVIWDILVYNSVHLIGSTTLERLNLLEELYGNCARMKVSDQKLEAYDHICITDGKGVYKAPAYTKYFNSLYTDLVQTDLYEGLILKRAGAKLTYGFQEKNNFDWQLKCRKATLNYSH